MKYTLDRKNDIDRKKAGSKRLKSDKSPTRSDVSLSYLKNPEESFKQLGPDTSLVENTLTPIQEFEKNNKKFQKFRDERNKSMKSQEFNELSRHGFVESSLASDQLMTYASNVPVNPEARISLDFANSSNRFLKRSSPRGLNENSGFYSKPINDTHVVTTEKISFLANQRSYNNSVKDTRINEDDEVNYFDSDNTPSSQKPDTSDAEIMGTEKRVRRDRNMRQGKNQPASYMNRPYTNLYAKPRYVKQ